MTDHSSSNFIDRFEELGLSRNEASVYIALLKNHPVTGYKLAKDSGILRPIVYEMLTRLVERGGVRIVKSSPEQYSPISPDTFLATLEKRFIDARSYLVEKLSDTEREELENDDFWTIYNKDAILKNIQETISKAHHQILFYCNNDEYAFYFKDIFSKKVASGVKVSGYSYRVLNLPSSNLYTYNIDKSIKNPLIPDDRILIVVDNKYSIIADMDAGKACQSSRPAQVESIADFIKMKITLLRIENVIGFEKLSLYLFEEDKFLLHQLQNQDKKLP
ncbi:MAG: TrmB family transcriptional regulator [Brevinema sp.]